MPEGHKTHWIARQHTALFQGQVPKVTSPQGRFRADARKVSGKRFAHTEAVGKHLFYHFEGGRIIHIHLGRYGKYRQHASPPPSPVGLVRLRWVGDEVSFDLNGPTTCRVIDAALRQEVVSKLGPDPLAGGRKMTVWHSFQKTAKPVGAVLLDQGIIAGVGNIFRAELLFELRLDPRTPAKEISRVQFDQLWKHLSRMMRTGLKYGKIVTVSSREAGRPLATLQGNDRFRIYGHGQCPQCLGEIEMLSLASRKLYWCPSCQKT